MRLIDEEYRVELSWNFVHMNLRVFTEGGKPYPMTDEDYRVGITQSRKQRTEFDRLLTKELCHADIRCADLT